MAQLLGTLDNFITRTRRWIGEETASKSRWSDNFLKQAINTAYRRRCAQIIMAFEGNFVVIATMDLVANQERYAWPTGFERLQKMELVRDDGRTVPIQRYERHYEIKYPPTTGGDSYNPNYRPIGSGFVLEPAPTESDSGAIRIEYIGTPEELTAGADEFNSDFPKMFDELVIYDSAIICFDQEQMQESGRMRSLLRLRAELENDFLRWIDNRMVNAQQVAPFVPHYNDA